MVVYMWIIYVVCACTYELSVFRHIPSSSDDVLFNLWLSVAPVIPVGVIAAKARYRQPQG